MIHRQEVRDIVHRHRAACGVLGVPTAVTGLFFWLLKRRIDKREDERAEIERARKE